MGKTLINTEIMAEIPGKWMFWVKLWWFPTLLLKLKACQPVPTSTSNLTLPLWPLEYRQRWGWSARALQSGCGQFQLFLVMWSSADSLNFLCFDGLYFGNKSNNSTCLTGLSWEINEIMNIEYFSPCTVHSEHSIMLSNILRFWRYVF